MDVKRYIDKCKIMVDPSARLIVTGKPHPSTDSFDVEIFYSWVKKAIREGTDRIKVIVGDKPNTWVVTVLDKKDG